MQSRTIQLNFPELCRAAYILLSRESQMALVRRPDHLEYHFGLAQNHHFPRIAAIWPGNEDRVPVCVDDQLSVRRPSG
jgi:hypothetical protein